MTQKDDRSTARRTEPVSGSGPEADGMYRPRSSAEPEEELEEMAEEVAVGEGIGTMEDADGIRTGAPGLLLLLLLLLLLFSMVEELWD